jgi:hypothetical protein
MKKGYLFFVMLLIAAFVNGQTVLFHESFDTPSNADSVVASGADAGHANFGINSRLYFNGNQSDSCAVQAADVTYLTTNSFSTIGYPFVFLNFNHICKIEVVDAGEVEVSVDNGVTWVKLTSTEYIDPGNSQFVNSGNKFSATTYFVDWDPMNNTTKPTNSWWHAELFNISALVGNQANVRVRFVLKDIGTNGANFAAGWFIDNLRITGAVSELTPPKITFKTPVYENTIFSTGYYDVYFYASDASGIQSANLTYSVNGGSNSTVPGSWVSDSTYKATIPSQTYFSTVSYFVTVTDNAAAHNVAISPTKTFYVEKPTVSVIVGTGTSGSPNLPVNGQFNYGWGYMIYKVSDLNFSGRIDSVGFYVNNTTTGYPMTNQRVYLCHTSSTNLTSAMPDTITMNMVRIFKGDITFVGPGWVKIKTQANFNYDGIHNLCIYWVNMDGSYVNSPPSFRYTATTSNNCAYNANNTQSLAFASGTQTLNRPNLKLCYVNQPYATDAGISSVVSPSGTVVGSVPVAVNVALKNYGSNTLTSAIIKWRLDGVYQDSVVWNGSLAEGVVTLPFNIANTTFTPGSHTIKVWSLKPNGINDMNTPNDTATVTFYSCNSILNGAYTIGSGGDYATVGDAVISLQNCGISGPVTFNILPGTYNGQITIPAIPGMSATNTVTFQSSTGVNTDVILQYTATAAADNWVLRLNGTDYMKFKNLTIKSTSTSAFARVVELLGGATNNTFEGNIIQSNTNTGTTTAAIYAGTTTSADHFNTFTNNAIKNGYYGIYIVGATAIKKSGTRIINNQITGFYRYGIYTSYNDSIWIEKNLIQNGAAAAATDHIFSSYNYNGATIIKNKIESNATGASGTVYGINFANSNGVMARPNLIANNFISQSGTSTLLFYGIYLNTTNLTNVAYNSVNIMGTNTSSSALYSTSGTTDIQIYNNVLAAFGGNKAIHVATTAPIAKCDYNDLYSTGSILGYWTANRANLAAWQTASLKDSNSVSGNPAFVSLTDLHTFSPILYQKGKPLTFVLDDIDGQLRSFLHTTIGADETQNLNYDLSLDSLISPKSSCLLTSNELVKIKICNHGLNPMSNITATYILNNGTPVSEVIPGPIDTATCVYYTFTNPVNLGAQGNNKFQVSISQAQDQYATNDALGDIWVNGAIDLDAGAYTMGFEPNENFSDWKTYNTDNSTFKWVMPLFSSTYAKTGSYSSQFMNAGTNIGEDWMISRCFTLQAGKTYALSFWYRTNNTTVQPMVVKYGHDQTINAMTTTLISLPVLTNIAYQQAITQFVAPVSGSYYFGWAGQAGIANSIYIDDINIRRIPDQEAAAVSITAPVTGCFLSNQEVVKLKIKNTGADTIAGNLTAYYSVNGGTVFSAPVNDTIIPNDIFEFSFPMTYDMSVTTADLTFNIESHIALAGDPVSTNDNTQTQVISRHSPGPPTASNVNGVYGHTANITANTTGTNTILWFADSTTQTVLSNNSTYTTPPLFNTTSYYAAATNNLSGPNLQVGNGTSTTSFVPAYGYWDYSWSSSLFLPSELNFSGKIDTLAFYVTNSTTYTMLNQKVFLRHYNGTTLPDNLPPATTSMTLVYSGTIVWHAGWNKIPLSVPFDYNGTSTLEMAWENWDGSWISGYPVFQSHTVPANMVKYDYDDGAMPSDAGTYITLRPNTKFIGKNIPGCPSTRIPVTVNIVIPDVEAQMLSIDAPVNQCTFGSEQITVTIKNNGGSTLLPGYFVGYYCNAGTTILPTTVPVIETCNTPIPSGATITYTFTNQPATPVTGGNQQYVFRTYVDATASGDPYQDNDTVPADKVVTLTYSPADPICAGATVPYGTTASLTATSVPSAPVGWFSAPVGGNSLGTGSPFITPTLYGTTTFYAEANTTIPGFITQVGSSSATNTNIPESGEFDYGWSDMLYLSSELNFLGRIDTLWYYVNNPVSGYTMINQQIFMAHTASATFANQNMPNTASMTKVFEGSISWTGPGWHPIVLTNQFYYNGADNLEIAFINNDGANAAGFPVFNCSSVPNNMVKFKTQNGSFPTTVGTAVTQRPNIKMYHLGFGCPSHRIPVVATVTSVPQVDAGMTVFTEPGSPISLGNHTVKAKLKNFGTDTLTSVQIKWTANGIAQTPVSWIGHLPMGADTIINLGTYNFAYKPYPANNDLVAWTELPNLTTDPTPGNDTATIIIDAHNPLSGIYNIRGQNPDYNSFTETLLPLHAWGVSGPVTFIADTGTYNENISILPVPGASSVNTVTYQSITGQSDDVKMIFAATGSSNNYLVQLNGADYIRFKNISFVANSAGAYGRVIEMKNGASYNYFEGNTMQGLVTTINSSTGIYCNDVTSMSNQFVSNTIKNGYQGTFINGSATNKIKGFKFVNNKFIDYYYYGMYLNNNDSILVSKNELKTSSASTNNYSIYALSCNNKSMIEKNRIFYHGTGAFYGIYMGSTNNNGSSSMASTVSNNFIGNDGSAGAANGIYLVDNNFLNVYFNSVNINAGTSVNTRALYQTGGTSDLNIANNNLANQVSGYAYYVNTPGNINISDYNNYYSNGSIIAYWSGDRNDLVSLQSSNSKDVHSKSVLPKYANMLTNDLHTQQALLIAAGTPISAITTDIDEEVRNAVHPCIGADEYSPSPIDGGITVIWTPTSPANSGSHAVKVTLFNFGINAIHNATIKYRVNNNTPSTYNFVSQSPGGLSNYDTVSFIIGNITLNAGSSIFKVWTQNINGGNLDVNFINDTATKTYIVCGGPLSGTYTVGGTNPSFYNLSDAALALTTCGINGPVTFNVAPGTYNERLSFGAITGASSINTITFQSANGNNTSVVIQEAGTGTLNNYVVQLNNSKYFRFKNMTLKTTSVNGFGRVVVLVNNCDYNEFEGNIIQSTDFSAIAPVNTASGIYCASGGVDYNKFINNDIKFGYHGAYYYGTASDYNKNNVFDNNRVTGWSTNGLYFGYADSIVVKGNVVTNGSSTTTGTFIYGNYCDNGSRFEFNKIDGNNNGAFYGMSINYCTGSTLEPVIVANNMINQSVGVAAAYAIYLNYSNYVNVYYNTARLQAGSISGGRALYLNNGTYNTLMNNNIVNNGSGYAIYVNSVNCVAQSNYNNFYSTSTSYAYWASNASNLAGLQAVSGKDLQSVSGDPVFVSSSDLHATAVSVDAKATPIPGYNVDIDGDARNATTPDIGADEFNALPYDVSVVAFVEPAGVSAPSGSLKNVKVTIKNMGSNTISSIPLKFKYGSNPEVSGSWSGTLLPNQTQDYTFTSQITVAAGGTSLCAYTIMPGDLNINNDTTCITYTGIVTMLVPYADNFEGTSYFFTQGTNNSWEYGVPISTTINAAHSPTKAWKTNLDGYYSNNEVSYLYTPYLDFGMVTSSTFGFWHFYETESNYDLCRIQYSTNGGSTWLSLGIYPNDPAGTNWYNANIGGKHCWTGNSGGWVYSSYDLSTISAIVNATQPVQFRFVFESNASNSSFDGWAIDDIEFTAPPIPKDAGVTAILQPAGTIPTGNNATVQVTIKNFGTDTLQAVPVRYRVNTGAVTSEVWHGNLNPGGTANYTFNTQFIAPGATYNLCAFTVKSGDYYWYNDSTCNAYYVSPANHDVGVINLLLPTPWPQHPDTCQLGKLDTVKITIKNFGTSTETSIPVFYNVNGTPIGAGNWTGSLAGGQTTTYTFTQKYTVPMGYYSICAGTQLSNDALTSNDSICEIYVGYGIGIGEYDYDGFSLMQNAPNPCNEVADIEMTIPSDGEVYFEVVDVVGKSMFAETKEYSAGTRMIHLDVNAMPAGIYFYTAKYKGKSITRRMVITR